MLPFDAITAIEVSGKGHIDPQMVRSFITQGKIPLLSAIALDDENGVRQQVEIIKTILAMQNRFIPPALNLTASDPACDLDYVPRRARAGNIDIALVNNSSFGGKNSVVVLRRRQK